MPNRVLAVVKFTRVSGVPRDAVENTFALLGHTGGDVDLPAATTALTAFYNATTAVPGGVRSVGEYINQTVSRTIDAQIEYYHAGVHGPPVHVDTFALTAAIDGSCLPDGVAIVGSIRADITGVAEHDGALRPRARRRGRVFIGPLVGVEMVDVTSGVPRVGTGPQHAIGQSLTNLVGNLSDTASSDLAVWSRVEDVMRPVLTVWTDNRFDTQRRREEEATARTFWLSS